MFEGLSGFREQLAISETMLTLLIETSILIVVIGVVKAITSRFIKKKVHSRELQRRWLVQTRNAFILLLMLGLIFIWGEALRTFALSVVAIAVAFVVATKELIVCVTGSIIKTGAGSFNIGDRIQVKDFRGDVIDQNILATTILEVGPGKLTHQRTGRMTVIPNSLFVSEPVINESYTHDFVLHVFTVPFKREEDWRLAQDEFLKSAQKQCKPYLKEARKHMEQLSQEKGLDVPTAEPRVTVQVSAAGEIHLIVRVPVKATQRSFIEQSILSDVFSHNDFFNKKEEEV
ncbi:mechanosensitive ion channel domain-containing protein [Rhodohalobacter sulfatireducens]|uniref:Mechanosensitive ion channel family protein n=1 Tax=Rhodohalobacter sulfatireducens TaxID=2911366 RepID=A0ABS9KGR0_9BACT|nr:mechanosensitive ion channel domain-containing protein [Rhodohalobacter sulfatireducens]MCG2590044.1 mechanosensitive ion channel family protein [Rhodohalobacter sulfatireducens]